MSKYNLVNNGTLTSDNILGNIALNWLEIESLHDGTTNSGIVDLTVSGSLHLELDLGNRIKIDGIRLYTSDATKSSYINFYYKNEPTDNYTICNKSATSEYYSAIIPNTSAPRFIKTVISGVDITINEFVVYNDDYIIGFGDTGTLDNVALDSAATGEEGIPVAVPLYNNSDEAMNATAYAVVDYTGNNGDKYVEISNAYSGPYYGFDDSDISITDNISADGWRWEHGVFSNTSIYLDKVMLSSIGNPGINKVTTLPYPGYTHIFGIDGNAWSYDASVGLLYVATVESSSNNPVRLRSYDFNTDSWTFISEMPMEADYASSAVSMAQHGRYIYFTMSNDEGSATFFGRYNLDGPQGNWQWLSAPGGSEWRPYYGTSISGGDYVYYLSGYYANGNRRFFNRFNVYTLTWEGLPLNYTVYIGNEARCSLMYDEARNYLYLDIGVEGAGDYIQRYHIATGQWDTEYLNYISKIGYDNHKMAVCYKDDKFYFKDYSYGTLLFVYDVTTDIATSIDVDFSLSNSIGCKVLLLPPLNSEADVTLLYSNIDGDNNSIYGYNLPDTYDSINYTTGIYRTPIFDITDKNMSSYFSISESITEGISTITYDRDTPDGTIRICSSDTAPKPIVELYWNVNYNSNNNCDILKYDVNLNIQTTRWVNYLSSVFSYYSAAGATAVCRRTGRIFVQLDTTNTSSNNQAYIYNRSANLLYSYTSNWVNDIAESFSDGGAEFTKDLGLWLYSAYSDNLIRVNYDLSLKTSKSNINTLDIAVEEDGNGVWYVDLATNRLVHLDGDGNSLNSISIYNTAGICSASNNGCWVISTNYNGSYAALRYNSEGVLAQTVTLRDYAYRLASDYDGGFYYFVSNSTSPNVFHVMSNGTEDMTATVNDPTRLKGCKVGVVVRSQLSANCKYVDRSTGTITATLVPNYNNGWNNHPAIFYWDNDTHKEFRDDYGSTILPLSYDPVWGNNADWVEVPKNGWFLPKRRYHRAEITLQSRSSAYNAYLKGVHVPKAIKVQDIPPGESKDFYIRTNIPDTVTTASDFSTKIKAWWDMED